MGAVCCHTAATAEYSAPCIAHFSIIRAIGRGAFGKVCIVQERSSKCYFAMKYMSKNRCLRMGMAENVLKELSILTNLNHPFIVNLHSSFQDARYMYIVSDLLLGGDLRYHLHQEGKFKEDRSKLYMCEISLAIDYLHSHNIIHRDIKPDNILLDEAGHAHLTDFNLATRLEKNELATSFSGTRPYMAPEILSCSLGQSGGYDERVDWWSLGATLHEMLRGRLPFPLPSSLHNQQVLCILESASLELPADWSNDLISFLSFLLSVDPNRRFRSLDAIKAHPYTQRIDFTWIFNRRAAPCFVPSQHGLNCDPLYEIEERVIGSTPMHERRVGRPLKSAVLDTDEAALQQLTRDFIEYSRTEFK